MQKRSSKKKRQPDYQQLARKVLDVVAPDAKPKAIKPAKKPPAPKRKQDAEDIDRAAGEGMAQPQGKNPAAVALGKLGGKIGGPARAKKLSKARRSEIAQKAAAARWKPKKKSK
jgi:hypothetical protein